MTTTVFFAILALISIAFSCGPDSTGWCTGMCDANQYCAGSDSDCYCQQIGIFQSNDTNICDAINSFETPILIPFIGEGYIEYVLVGFHNGVLSAKDAGYNMWY